ncbi:helix-turn-helix domain-containing protein [Kordiimonas pumila]|uniref:Helix-turn-helix domain-containing protein n=1 Tax=Kordiimonas pumila TaxID=2161677 RepID=A0ABV7D5H8_9PROT|nr:helix-turn-helix transcriptional regulator [Kordiimonas pumila]
MTSLGKVIAELREEKGYQSKYVALTAGISCDRYSRIETGSVFPSDEELVAIADALEIDVNAVVRNWETYLLSKGSSRLTKMI